MKTHSLVALALAGCVSLTTSVRAAALQQATLTRVIKTVEVLPPGKKPEPASLGQLVQGDTGVQTGTQSRAELTFPDETLIRIGANTLFHFNKGTRQVDLENGTILLSVPKGAGGATLRTTPVTAAITGTTVMMEYVTNPKPLLKFIVIEGEARLSLNGRLGESVVLKAGQMIAMDPNSSTIPDPVDVDLKRILKTSKLINDGELPNDGEIQIAANQQQILKNEGTLLEVNLFPPEGGNTGTLLAEVQNNIQNNSTVAAGNAVVPRQAPAPRPTPIPVAPTPRPKPPRPEPTGTGGNGSYPH